MTLSAAQLSALRVKAKLLLGISDDDTSYHRDAIAIYDDGSVNATSTVSVLDAAGTYTMTLTGDVSGADALDLTAAANDTLTELLAAIAALAGGHVTTLLYPDGGADSSLLVRKVSTNIFGVANEVTLTIEDNGLLDYLIQAAFTSVESALGRALFSADYTERYQIAEHRTVKLEQPDITAVSFVGADLTDALSVTYTGAGTRATVEVTDTQITLRSRAGGTTTETAITFAANGSTTDCKTAIDLIAGWSATVRETMPSAYLARVGVQNVKSEEITLAGYEDYDWTYSTDYEAGLIEFQTWPSVISPWTSSDWIVVGYTAGFATLPADIEGVILSVTKAGWDEAQKDSSVIEERLGDYSYKLPDGATGAALSNVSEHETILARYRRWNP